MNVFISVFISKVLLLCVCHHLIDIVELYFNSKGGNVAQED